MKQTVFEPAARVPLIMAGAGVSTHARGCTRPVELLDIYPTLAEICKLEGTPATLHGRSLLPLLNNPSAQWDKPAISQVRRPSGKGGFVMGYSLRTERYRYSTREQGGAGEELYDYQTDPREIRNMAQDASMGKLKQQLHTRLMSICRERGMSPQPGTA